MFFSTKLFNIFQVLKRHLFLHRANITMLFFGPEKDLYYCSSVLSCIVEMHLAKYAPLYIGEINQFVWYACTFEFMWCTQYAQDPVTKLVSLFFYQSDCCKLPCHSHSPLHDGCVLPKRATWTNHLTDTSGETRRRWPSNSGSFSVNIWSWRPNILMFSWIVKYFPAAGCCCLARVFRFKSIRTTRGRSQRNSKTWFFYCK